MPLVQTQVNMVPCSVNGIKHTLQQPVQTQMEISRDVEMMKIYDKIPTLFNLQGKSVNSAEKQLEQ